MDLLKYIALHNQFCEHVPANVHDAELACAFQGVSLKEFIDWQLSVMEYANADFAEVQQEISDIADYERMLREYEAANGSDTED